MLPCRVFLCVSCVKFRVDVEGRLSGGAGAWRKSDGGSVQQRRVMSSGEGHVCVVLAMDSIYGHWNIVRGACCAVGVL